MVKIWDTPPDEGYEEAQSLWTNFFPAQVIDAGTYKEGATSPIKILQARKDQRHTTILCFVLSFIYLFRLFYCLVSYPNWLQFLIM